MDDLLSTLSQATGAQVPQAAAPAASPGAFDPTKSYGTPPQMLDNLLHTESSGNPYAVNKTTGAMGPYQFMPGTVADLRKQGVKFDPFDPQQARAAADWYLQTLKTQNGGTYEGALKAYGGFVTKDASQYVSKVMNGVPGAQGAPAPTIPGQSYSGQQPGGYTGPTSDLMDTLNSAMNAPAQPAKPAAPQPTSEASDLTKFGRSAAGLADTVLSAPGQAIQAGEYAVRRALGESPEQIQNGVRDASGKLIEAPISQGIGAFFQNPVGKAFGVTNTPEYQGEASQRAMQAVGGAVNQGVSAVAGATGLPAQDVANMAGSLSMAVPGAVGKFGAAVVPAARHIAGVIGDVAADTAASDLERPAPTVPAWQQAKATYAPQAAPSAAPSNVSPIRASIGAAGTSYAQQAAAEGVPDVIVQKIDAAEKSGTLNPVAAERHIEAGSLPVPVELTAGQASGDVNQLSHEMNTRGKNPELAARFNAQNGQIADNLTAIRDQVSPNVNVPSGVGTGQALVDAYKEMDAPIQQQIAEQYARARNADGTSALVDATVPILHFEQEIGPTRFNALPSRVQQIFADAKNNRVTLPAQFDQPFGSSRPMNARDIMDIDQSLSGAIAEAKSPAVQHDIGQLRAAILSAPIDPAAGPEAVQAFKTAQASARARFQAMDADPAYKAAVNDSVPHGEPSPLADQFAQKYIASGKTSNVQNMLQNLSNDPINRELVASALMDHIRAQAGVDLRTGTGNISQAGLNKALQNLGEKTRIVLGPEASQTVEKLGNVARYTQEQPRGSYVNNSNTFVATVANAAKSSMEGAANVAAHGVPVGTWTRQALERRANAKEVARSLEPGAGLNGVPLNSLMQNKRAP